MEDYFKPKYQMGFCEGSIDKRPTLMMWPQSKDHQQPPEAGTMDSSLKDTEGAWPCQHQDFSSVKLICDFHLPTMKTIKE